VHIGTDVVSVMAAYLCKVQCMKRYCTSVMEVYSDLVCVCMVHCMKRYCTSVMEAYSDLVCVYGSMYEEVLYQCYGGIF